MPENRAEARNEKSSKFDLQIRTIGEVEPHEPHSIFCPEKVVGCIIFYRQVIVFNTLVVALKTNEMPRF